MLDTLWLVSVFLLALSAGAAFTHVLEVPGKRGLPLETVVVIQQRLYVGYRYTGLALESGAIAALVAATCVAYGDGVIFWLSLAALGAVLGTTLVFVAWTDRKNRVIARWRAGDALPPDAKHVLSEWELSHATRAVLFLAGIACVLAALITG